MTKAETVAPASGRQYEIAAGAERVVVTEVGATLRSYTVNERDVLDGFAEDERSSAGRGQVLAPWPNRLEDGRYTFEGRRRRAPPGTSPSAENAIHGLVRWLHWQGVERADRRGRAALHAAAAARVPVAPRAAGPLRARRPTGSR